jgi:hypothetical protein
MLHAEDPAADSLVVIGLTVMTTLCGLAIYDAIWLGNRFEPLTFSGAGAALIASIGGGKRFRDGMGRKHCDDEEEPDERKDPVRVRVKALKQPISE